jgi:protein Tex
VQVTVIEVDLDRKRIALSMKSKPDFEKRQPGAKTPGSNDRNGGNRSFNGGGQRGGNGGGLAGGVDWFSAAVSKGKK